MDVPSTRGRRGREGARRRRAARSPPGDLIVTVRGASARERRPAAAAPRSAAAPQPLTPQLAGGARGCEPAASDAPLPAERSLRLPAASAADRLRAAPARAASRAGSAAAAARRPRCRGRTGAAADRRARLLHAPMPVRRCASSRASWASIWRACRARASRAASRTTTSRPASSRRSAARRGARRTARRRRCRRCPRSTSRSSAPVEIKPLTRIQKISGPRLQASWVNIPHVTQFDEADITELEDARSKLKAEGAQRRASSSRRSRSSCAPASRRCRSSRTSTPRSIQRRRTWS